MRRLCSLLVGIALSLGALPAAAQRGAAYCNVTEITSEQLSNGVSITITSDGELGWFPDFDRLIQEGAFVPVQRPWGQDVEPTERFAHLPFVLPNARSMLGSGFVPVGKYPVSHVVISIPEWAQEGVGLVVDVVNYLGAVRGEGRLREWRYNLDFRASEDGRSLIVTWTSDRFPAEERPQTPKDLPEELEVKRLDGRLTVRAVNAKIQSVASAISRAVGFPVAAPLADDVRVSACLDDVLPEEALQAIAIGCGLCACPAVDGGWVIAEPQAGGSGYAASCTRRIPLAHLRATEALNLLPDFLLGYMHADEEANGIVITGPEWMVERVAEDLAKLDIPAPQVELEVVAVELRSSDALLHDLQLAGHWGERSAAVDTLTGDLNFLWLKGIPRGWELLLQSREVQTAGRLQSRGALRVASGHTARIFAGQQRYIVVERAEEGLTAELESANVGTEINVHPRVGAGEEVALDVDLEIRNLRGADPVTGLPVIGRRSASSSVRVRDGETIVIAGMRREEESRQERGLPILSALPLVGGAFRSWDRVGEEDQLVVFITPHIIRAPLAEEGGVHYG